MLHQYSGRQREQGVRGRWGPVEDGQSQYVGPKGLVLGKEIFDGCGFCVGFSVVWIRAPAVDEGHKVSAPETVNAKDLAREFRLVWRAGPHGVGDSCSECVHDTSEESRGIRKARLWFFCKCYEGAECGGML